MGYSLCRVDFRRGEASRRLELLDLDAERRFPPSLCVEDCSPPRRIPSLVMCRLGLEATGRARLGLAQAKPGQACARLGLASGSGLSF